MVGGAEHVNALGVADDVLGRGHHVLHSAVVSERRTGGQARSQVRAVAGSEVQITPQHDRHNWLPFTDLGYHGAEQIPALRSRNVRVPVWARCVVHTVRTGEAATVRHSHARSSGARVSVVG